MRIVETEYEALRPHLTPELASLPDPQLRAHLAMHGIDAENMEGFFDDLGKFAATAGKAVLKAAPSILPVAGSIVGTAFGGPIGASLGGSLGSLAGQGLGALTGQKPPAGGPAAGGGGLGGLISGGLGALLGGGGGGGAASQLLQTITRPETLKALGSMAMGSAGNPNVPIGGTSVPVAAFGNLLKTLVGKAEAEYAESVGRTGTTPAYMRSFDGEAVADPSIPDNRALALYALLQAVSREAELEYAEAAAEAAAEAEAEGSEQEMEAIQAEYDAIELMEVYESEYAEYESEEA
jgi:hypothetical protein